MPSTEEILKDKLSRLESIPKDFTDSLMTFEKKVYNELLTLFDKLETKNGKIVVSKRNLLISQQIIADIKKLFSGQDYVKILGSFIGEFDEQANINNAFFKKEFGSVGDESILEAILTKNKQDALELLSGSSIDVNFINPVRTFLDNSIINNSSVIDLIDGIKSIAVTTEKNSGKLIQYSRQIANDTFAFNDRNYSKVISESLGAEWFKYAGGQVDSSRCFCIERHNKYYHKNEIEAWGDGKNIGVCRVGDHWAGAYKNTNSSNIFTVAGGYNCMHSILMVSLFKVPKDDIIRNIKNGNFEPTEKQLNQLKIKL